MWAVMSGRCARYLGNDQHGPACTHATPDPACSAQGSHAGWLRNTDEGWRCGVHLRSGRAGARMMPDRHGGDMADEEARRRWNPEGRDEVTHRCPPKGSGVMPCCDQTPLEVPLWHRLTLDPALVTCKGREND